MNSTNRELTELARVGQSGLVPLFSRSAAASAELLVRAQLSVTRADAARQFKREIRETAPIDSRVKGFILDIGPRLSEFVFDMDEDDRIELKGFLMHKHGISWRDEALMDELDEALQDLALALGDAMALDEARV